MLSWGLSSVSVGLTSVFVGLCAFYLHTTWKTKRKIYDEYFRPE